MNKKNVFVFTLILCTFFSVTNTFSSNNRVRSIRAAKLLAERALVESIYGLKICSTEEMNDLLTASFKSKTNAKTVVKNIKGIEITESVYDEERDLAKATAQISLRTISNIDGQEMDLKGKIFTRTAFASSNPANTERIKALRVAELDAYTQLARTVKGFALESDTTTENSMLISDMLDRKVLASMYLAHVVDFGWKKTGDAYIKMSLHLPEVEEIFGCKIQTQKKTIEVEGQGACDL